MENLRISASDLEKMHHLYRANLINSLSGYKSANLIGSVDDKGIENMAIFSSVTHFGSNPPILGLVTRPTTVPRNSYKNIKATKYYTINHVHKDIIEEAHLSSAKYPSNVSEFEKTNLVPWYSPNFKAPYVAGCAIQIGMKFLEEYHIKANNTILVLGKIVELWLNQNLLDKTGLLDLNAAETVTISGLDSYHLPALLDRFAYARPDQLIQSLTILDEKH
ncbi:MAG: flavin oxidoreductase [Aureispira sp.]|nr:flavin oxidoreductase [Aureispira sp.]